MKFSKKEIYEYVLNNPEAGYYLIPSSHTPLVAASLIHTTQGKITIELNIDNADKCAYIYEPTEFSLEICDRQLFNGRPIKATSERAKLNEKITAYYEKQKLEQQIAKQPETPKMKFKM